MRIEICGGIATGKSTLAARIAEGGHALLIKESYRNIPYWTKFYTDTRGYALEKNLGFLLSHADAIPESSAKHDGQVVCDYAMFQDLVYAKLGPPEDFPTLYGLYERLTKRLGPPKTIIYLSCRTATQIERIIRRGRRAEQTIPEAYLLELNSRLDAALRETITQSGADLIEYNTDEMNFASDPAACEAVSSRLIKHLGQILGPTSS
jgi:deoxyadenosine/deoxycytidine kinase